MSTSRLFQHTAARRRLEVVFTKDGEEVWFQHTAARRRLDFFSFNTQPRRTVSTHSRPKAAGALDKPMHPSLMVSTHSRPKAAGALILHVLLVNTVSTHSRPKAAGGISHRWKHTRNCFNTQPPEGGWCLSQKPCSIRFRSPDFAKLPRKA